MRKRILSMLDSHEFVSGQAMARELEISRTGVWKHIKVLQDLGYEIETVKNRGYRLISSPGSPVKEEMERDLDTKIIGKEVEFHRSMDSTNKRGKALAREKVSEGYVIIADEQTTGRGRRSRRWSSAEGGLWFSVVLYPGLPINRGMLVTMIASVSVLQGIKEATGLEAEIKWPNDLLLDGKKVCGILTEMDAEIDMIENMVLGIGINVNNELEEDLKDIATELKEHTGKEINRVDLLKEILRALDRNYELIKEGKHVEIKDLWMEYSGIIGKEVSIDLGKESIEGKVLSVDETGGLIIEAGDGERKVFSGDLRYI